MASSSQVKSLHPVGFQIQADDNVATMLERAEAGPVSIRCHSNEKVILLRETIEMGHKVALQSMETGTTIVKYGVVIGVASATIQVGDWVHLHNCKSRLDERSGTLDLHTGLPEDTRYE
jgi:hypothetical protein